MRHLMDLTVNIYERKWKLRLMEGTYQNGAPALALQDTEGHHATFAILTVNLPPFLPDPGEYLIKTWSENEKIYELLVEDRILIPTDVVIPTGFVSAVVCKLEGGDR